MFLISQPFLSTRYYENIVRLTTDHGLMVIILLKFLAIRIRK